MELFEDFDDGQWFFFDGGVVFLGFVEFAGAECTWKSVLFDDRSWLKVGGVRLCVKRWIVVGVDEWCIHLNECFHLVESLGVFIFPFERSRSFEQIRKWGECV